MKIWTVGAFASKPYTGNPAAVILVDEFPDDQVCQKIAAEMNLSETTFVKPLGSDTFHIRWFTPTVEVNLCGHATLAAAHILFQENRVTGNTMELQSLSGPLTVTREGKNLILDFPLHPTGPNLPKEGFGEKLNLTDPIIAVVQADDDIILEMESPNAVRAALLDPKDIIKLGCRDLILTAKGDGPYDFISRVFSPSQGIDEDPVTGSAHCKLAHYWQQKMNKNTFVAYQASKRGGEIHITIHQDRVLLKGTAITIMEGTWLV